MELVALVIACVVGFLIFLLGIFWVVKGAVLESLKEHTRWVIANRESLEAKHGKKPAQS